MAEFSKRSEVTVQTMGKVHNPTGGGVAPFAASTATTSSASLPKITTNNKEQQQPLLIPSANPHHHPKNPNHGTKADKERHVTTKIEEGSSRRNIARRKTDPATSGRYDNRAKRMGGAGKGMRGNDDPIGHALSYAGGGGGGNGGGGGRGGGGGDSDHGTGAMGALGPDDPLYVPEEDDDPSSYVLSSGGGGGGGAYSAGGGGAGGAAGVVPVAGSGGGVDRPVYGPLLTLSEFKIRASDAIREYFDSSDPDEVVRCVHELKCRPYHPEVVKRAISLGCDEGPRERELVSRLLACLHPDPLADGEMEAGFGMVLDAIEELTIDIPDAKAMVGSFLARAVIDEVLAPAFLSNRNNSHPGDPVVEKAVGLLSREHCTARLERVWGPGDGRPVKELKDSMDQLLKEYLLSRELDEAASCVRELKAPHFHHELVKRGVRIAMEEDGGRRSACAASSSSPPPSSSSSAVANDGSSSLDAMAALFVFLANNSIVSEYQVAKGVDRLRRAMEDVRLDVPAAPGMLDEFESMASSILLK